MKKEVEWILEGVNDTIKSNRGPISSLAVEKLIIESGINIRKMEEELVECYSGAAYSIRTDIWVVVHDGEASMALTALLTDDDDETLTLHYDLSKDYTITNKFTDMGFDIDRAIKIIEPIFSGRISYRR